MDQRAEEWNELLSKSASRVPFLRHEYLSTWWRTLGGGEWARGELYVVTAAEPDGSWSAIAPLFFTDNRDAEPALMLLGSIEISDYLDLIVQQNHTTGFIEALLAHLDGPQAPAWKVLDWYNILEDSPTLPALKAAAERRGWEYAQERLLPAPCVPLPGDWEAYLAGLDKKQRHEIRRKMRRAESHDPPVRWYVEQDEGRLDAQVEAFMSLMAQDIEKASFLTAVMRTQMRASVHAAFRAGWLKLAFLEVGGEKAAGYLNFDYANRIWLYNSGWDPRFGELSPGWVLLSYLMRWANENQREAFDFMRGDEDYKYRFGGIDRFVARAVVRR
ncbi:MAG TPA: GNAT family N-acetyltransferase [Anaerolineales bacterium]|nr:GNAT family N-acetyltransferase [Anaerolineales bacterium]